MPRVQIVVPCFNEAARLRPSDFWLFASREPQVRFVFVNDGSTDGTAALLQRMASLEPLRFSVVELPANQGKAEAVRQGMCRALDDGASYAGYWDADLATPLDEIPRFLAHLEAVPALQLVLGARVQLLGRSVDRSPFRHYVGRVFATLTSLTLGLPVYDTQCGAKLFRNTPLTRALFEEPFASRWAFDVEILARLLRDARVQYPEMAQQLVCELPLQTWRDVPGSKVRPGDFLKSVLELVRIRTRVLKTLPTRAADHPLEPRATRHQPATLGPHRAPGR